MTRWHSFSDEAQAAATHPAIIAVLAASEKVVGSTLDNDADLFVAHQAPECMVNNPANRVVAGAGAGALMRRGLIHYDSFERHVEHAGVLPDGMVVLMGEEVVVPRGANELAGKTVRRRFTDVWREVDGAWKLSVRQATNVMIE